MNGMQTGTTSGLSPMIAVPQDRVRRLLKVADIARYCGVPTEEVLGWIDNGMLRANYLPHGRYRIATGDFLAFAQKYEIVF